MDTGSDSNGDIALPLYEGRMIGPFDPSKKGWVSGKGRTAEWREIPYEDKVFEPQYLLSLKAYLTVKDALRGNKIGLCVLALQLTHVQCILH